MASFDLRLRQLSDNILRDMELLKQYEDILRYEDDPIRIERYHIRIKRLQESISEYQREYEDIQRQAGGDLSDRSKRNDNSLKQPEAQPNKIKVLFLAANPGSTERLALDEEIREIAMKIRAADYRESIELISAWAVRPDDLIQLLNQHRPQIVHFSGHGSNAGEIISSDNNGIHKPISSKALKTLFNALRDNIKVVVLNACYSKKQAKAITQIIDCTVGMSDSIGDKAAITFAASFYRAIGFGRSVKESFDQGIAALLLEGIPEEDTPELLVRSGIDSSQVFLIRQPNS